MLNRALCGEYPCRHLCSRVEHCPAGQQRVKYLWFHRRVVRSCPPGVDPITGEIFTQRHRLHRLKEAILSNVYGPKQLRKRVSPLIIGRRIFKFYTEPILFLGFAIILAIVILAGFIIYGPNLVGTHEPAPVNYPPYEWMWER